MTPVISALSPMSHSAPRFPLPDQSPGIRSPSPASTRPPARCVSRTSRLLRHQQQHLHRRPDRRPGRAVDRRRVRYRHQRLVLGIRPRAGQPLLRGGGERRHSGRIVRPLVGGRPRGRAVRLYRTVKRTRQRLNQRRPPVAFTAKKDRRPHDKTSRDRSLRTHHSRERGVTEEPAANDVIPRAVQFEEEQLTLLKSAELRVAARLPKIDLVDALQG
jgi:hypothetical protein